MTTAVIVGGALALCFGIVMLFLRYLENRVENVIGQQQDVVERISTLELNDDVQDVRLANQQWDINRLKDSVKELGEDVGWDGDRRKTELNKTMVMLDPLAPLKKLPDKPPDDAA